MDVTVQHGRRRGQDRITPELPFEMTVNGQVQSAPAHRANIKEVCVLSQKDWNRIQSQLHRRQTEAERQRQAIEAKKNLHQRSLEQTKNWSNTIVGQRQKKLEARAIREAKEEEERKLIDIEEAKFQAAQRKEAIEKAKTQQYYQTDRVKGFHSALQLTEVLKERDAQCELNRLRIAASAGREREYLEYEQREKEQGILYDQQRAMQQIRKNKEAANFQLAQAQRNRKLFEEEREEDRLEGEELKKLNEQYLIEKKKLEDIKKAEADRLMRENLKQIDDVNMTRLIQQRQEEEEDEECRIFAAAKRKMMKLRAEKERQLHREKQEKLDKIKSKLHAQNLQKLDDEDDRIKRAVEEAEAKRESEEKEREERTKKAFEEMAKHRHEQMKEVEAQKLEEKKKELEMLALKKEIDSQFARNEEEKRLKKYNNMKGLSSYHKKQSDERENKQHQSRINQLAQDAHNMKLIELEEQQFQEYANKVIKHCEDGGRNVYPLKKAARVGAGGGLGPLFTGKGGIRPSYLTCDQDGTQLPTYQRATTEEVKDLVHGSGNTEKRLGFVW